MSWRTTVMALLVGIGATWSTHSFARDGVAFSSSISAGEVRNIYSIVECALRGNEEYWMNIFRLRNISGRSGDDSVEKCVRQRGNEGFHASAIVMSGAFAHAFYKRPEDNEIVLNDVPMTEFQNNPLRRNSIYVLADCVLWQSPIKVSELIETELASDDELGAFRQLEDAVMSCGEQRVDRTELRGALAYMLFWRSLPAETVRGSAK